MASDSPFPIPNQCRKTANLRGHEQKAVSYIRDHRQHPHFSRAGRRCTRMSGTNLYLHPRPLEVNSTSLRRPRQRIVLTPSLTGSGPSTQYVSNARCKNGNRFSLVSRLAVRNTITPKGVATWPPVWKFVDRYSIPSLVIVFTPRNGVGIENRASQWGEKANVRVFQYCI